MYGHFTTRCYAEVIQHMHDGYHEATFEITLNCVSPGSKGRLYGEPGDCYEAEASEWEIDTIQIIGDDGKGHTISEDVLKALVGEKADKMLGDVVDEAIEDGVEDHE